MKRSARGAIATGLATAGSALLSVYWFVVRPWHVRWGATDEEVARAMPGDELVVQPILNTTRAITIDAPPEAIWPWLVQLGQGRGGWYSYEWIENRVFGLDIHNAQRILPQFQSLKVGDVIPTGAPGADIPVLAIEPNRTLLLGGAGVSTIAIGLYPLETGGTRLVMRNRSRFGWSPGAIFWLLLMDPGTFIMTRKMLLTLKRLAETPQPAPPPTVAELPDELALLEAEMA